MRRFGLETDIDCAHFGLESGMVFEGIKGVYQRLYCFNFKCVRKKDKYANLRNLFSCCQHWRKAGVYINAKFAINSHCSYKKNLAIKSLCIFYKPRI